jgi:uncharacterized protein YprB with RNaseH-like and TPR domain
MDLKGKVIQRFLDDPRNERELLEWFVDWLSKTKTTLITYASKSADEPQLRNALGKFGLPLNCLSRVQFLDLFYDVIFTQSPRNQKVFLPIIGNMGEKEVSQYFGYREPEDAEIHDGLQALMAYQQYLRKRSERIKNELLAYNCRDLERTAVIYCALRRLFDKQYDNHQVLDASIQVES